MQNNNENKNLLSIGEASEYLGISIDTLRRWERKKRIDPLRSPGGHRYYSKEDLDNLFGKRYVRDEPTHRSKGLSMADVTNGSKRESSINNLTEKTDEKKLDETKEPEELVNKQEISTISEAWPNKLVSFEESYISTQYSETYNPEPTSNNSGLLDRPIREIRVPEINRLKIIQEIQKEEVLLTPQEAYIRQQNVSILTPYPAPEKNPVLSPLPVPQPTNQNTNVQNSSSLDFLFKRKTLIYISLLIGVALLSLGWYYLWASSQQILSPVP